jgi:tetratricopeptide (TPR) repeat protein
MPVDTLRLKELFVAAAELPAADRAGFLDRECGADAELRKRVAALLKAHDAPGSFLADPVPMPAEAPEDAAQVPSTVAYHPSHAPGTVIADRYTLVEKLGEGGMGEVWVAKQSEPVKRKVALKLIKTGMDSKTVLTRFEQERQALGLMDHPNIARVLDGGLTPSGQPFFVMELVNGLPLTKFCDEMKLTPRERMELFVPICQAVQHAHQKGIIHRDLKPSNILVTVIDAKGVPKIIDFGVAKATAGRLTEESLSTQFGAVIGTLEYMAPEQAGFTGQDVDTRADVYSLGVILYELLTGLRPHDGKQLRQAAYVEILRILHEEEPSKPSTRLSTDASLPSLAALRRTDPKKLMAMLRGELDWVVMKCLEKDRNRRYETAIGLARDIEHYLADEPVEARPPSLSYRARKFVRRNRGGVIAAATVIAAVLVGTAAAAWQAVRATQAEKDAILERDEKEQALSAEKKARVRTREALDEMSSRVMEDWLSRQPFELPEQRQFLERTAKFYEEFAAETGANESERALIADANLRLAAVAQRLGRDPEAAQRGERAEALFGELLDQHPSKIDYRRGVVRALRYQIRGLLNHRKPDEVETLEVKAIALADQLVAEDPNDLVSLADLCALLINRGFRLNLVGRFDDGLATLDRALPLQERMVKAEAKDDRQLERLAMIRNNRMVSYEGRKQFDKADPERTAALELFEAIARRSPSLLSARASAARMRLNLGMEFARKGQAEEAVAEYRKAEELTKALIAQYPGVLEYRTMLISLYPNWSRLLLRERELPEALEMANRFIQTGKDLGWKAYGSGERADCLAETGQLAEAEREYTTVITDLSEKLDIAEVNTWDREGLVGCYAGRARTLYRRGSYRAALLDWDKAIEHSPEAGRAALRIGRATSRLQVGPAVEAMAEAAKLMKATNLTPSQWYECACIYAVASGKIVEKKQEYADRAMELLRRTVQAGWKYAARIAEDTDLDSLRNREDFKKLMSEFQAAAKAPKNP